MYGNPPFCRPGPGVFPRHDRRPAPGRSPTDHAPTVAAMPATLDTDAAVQGLIDFVDASPSPFHAVRTAVGILQPAGFTEVVETDRFLSEPGRYYVVRGGSLVAGSTENRPRAVRSLRIVGGHPDS